MLLHLLRHISIHRYKLRPFHLKRHRINASVSHLIFKPNGHRIILIKLLFAHFRSLNKYHFLVAIKTHELFHLFDFDIEFISLVDVQNIGQFEFKYILRGAYLDGRVVWR